MNLSVLVIKSKVQPNYLASRTVRQLQRLGVPESKIRQVGNEEADATVLSGAVDGLDVSSGLLLIRAGAWLANTNFHMPPSSSTGRSLVAIGAVRNHLNLVTGNYSFDASSQSPTPADSLSRSWDQLLSESGGDFQSESWRAQLSELGACCWLEAKLADVFVADLQQSGFEFAWEHVFSDKDSRLVHWHPLDVFCDPNLRAIQIITSLQRGGAERIAIDLHRCWLRSQELTPLLIAVNAPSRSPFPTPPATLQLAQVDSKSQRWERCQAIIENYATDLLHTHLLSREEHQLLRKTGCRMMATIHNAQAGWQPGTEDLDCSDLDLLVACSQAVERDLKSARVTVPIRTVWNGINLAEFQVTQSDRVRARSELIVKYCLPQDAILVTALANPRPQKRLERLPGILWLAEQHLKAANVDRPIYLLIAGEPAQHNQFASQSMQLILQQIAKIQFSSRVIWLGAVEDTRSLLAGVDLLVSPSDYEGLSLAQLEALSCGVEVVASNVGGTSEIAAFCDGLSLVDCSADDAQFASHVVEAIRLPTRSITGASQGLARDFSLTRMRDGYWRLYKRLANLNQCTKPNGVLLVTNNFSTGGAQSSARRLLLSLRNQGVLVRAAVLQEDLNNPTPGRQHLALNDVDVLCLPKSGAIDPLQAMEGLFCWIDQTPPEHVLLWNVISEYKVLLADSLLSTPVIDVSPGEMNLQSLDRYFQNPRPGLPYRTLSQYGQRLSCAVVKYAGEKAQVETALQVPTFVIPNGVRIPEFAGKFEPTLASGKLVLGTAVRISPQKRLEDLLAAFELVHGRLPSCELRIAGSVERGSDDYFEELKSRSAGLPVQWVGEFADTVPFLLQLDAFVMISEPAGCPNASLEAMAVGLPVIATDVGGASEQVVDQLNGLLVPARDAEALARAILRVCQDGELRKRFGQASRARAIELFTVERMTLDYLRLFSYSAAKYI